MYLKTLSIKTVIPIAVGDTKEITSATACTQNLDISNLALMLSPKNV